MPNRLVIRVVEVVIAVLVVVEVPFVAVEFVYEAFPFVLGQLHFPAFWDIYSGFVVVG